MVEWEITLDCNHTCGYCVNSRNSALPEPIPYETDKDKVFAFLDMVKESYPGEELFVFGGEPFLHPFIGDIIEYMNKIELPFIIQTNFAYPIRMKVIGSPFKVQVSVHPTQIKNKEFFVESIRELQDIIRRIDVMYVGEESFDYYKKILKVLDDRDKLYIAPVADFKYTKVVNEHLYEFNRMKKGIQNKIYRFEEGDRSFIWEQQMRGELTYKYQPCMYKDTYKLFDPLLRKYTCSYRENNDICPNDHCFLM